MNASERVEAESTDSRSELRSGDVPPQSQPIRPRRRSRLLKEIRYRLSAGRLWYYSTRAYQAGWYPLAWLIKAFCFLCFKSLLCFQCKIEDDIKLVHFSIGSVIHPNVTIGRRVKIFHHVSIAAETPPGSPSRVIIEDDVVIGMYAIIIGNDEGGIRIGKGAVIGAGAIVNRDVPPGAVVLPMPSRPVKMVKTSLD